MGFMQLQAIGNVGRDPEMTYTQTGNAVTKFSVAVTKKGKDGNSYTTWLACTSFGNLAEMINTHMTKGAQVFVQGDLTARQYTTKDGRSGVSLDLIVEKFQFAGTKAATAPGNGDLVTSDLGELDDHPF